MSLLHFINAFAWFANAVLWSFYAGSVFMGLASLAAATLAGWLGWRENTAWSPLKRTGRRA